jgi:hypothetical protein
MKTVDMIHAKARDFALLSKFEDESVNTAENLFSFHPERDEIVDAEESSIIDLLRCHFPEAESKHLLRRRGARSFIPVRGIIVTVKYTEVLVNGCMDLAAPGVDLPQGVLDKGNLLIAFFLAFL